MIPARGFDNPPCGRGMVTRPGIRILTDWAMSCCGIGVYEGDSPLCGRSPGRSVAVTVRFSCGWEHLWYCSLFDQGKVTVMEAPDSPRAHGLPAPTEWGLVWGEFLKVVFQLELKHGLSSLVMQVAKREVSVWDSVLCALFRLQTQRMQEMLSSRTARRNTAMRFTGKQSCRVPWSTVCTLHWYSNTSCALGVPEPPCCRLPDVLRRHGAHGMPEPPVAQ